METTEVKVLVVEDNPGDARLIAEMFKESQLTHKLAIAETIADAVALIQHNTYHVILLDISLPDSSGIETITCLRTHAQATPIVVLTGFNDEQLGVEAVAEGAQDYLIKGDINAAVLLRSVRYARERHQVELANQELAALQERQRLARDLHDSVTQTLFSANVITESSLMQWTNNPPKAYRLMQQVHQLTKGALAEMRVLLLELRPESLLDVPLETLIQQLIDSAAAQKDIIIHADLDAVPQLVFDTKVSIYRIAQEAFNNIFKHAYAKTVNITLKYANDTVRLLIRDDGVGFDITATSGNSLGLHIMQERAAQTGAELHIRSRPGDGTLVTLTIHIKQETLKTS